MALTSLKISKKEMKDREKEAQISIGAPDGERYPYGTRLDLDDETLDKLGIDKLPSVGATMMIEAKVTVIGSRQSATKERTNRALELQITDMEIEMDEGEEEEGELTRSESGAMSALAKRIKDY